MHLWSPPGAKKEWCETADVIEMKVADPDSVEVWPVKLLLSHPVRRIGANVKQQCAHLRLKPVSGGRAMRMRDGCARAKHNQLHIFSLTLETA